MLPDSGGWPTNTLSHGSSRGAIGGLHEVLRRRTHTCVAGHVGYCRVGRPYRSSTPGWSGLGLPSCPGLWSPYLHTRYSANGPVG